jgi:hypothetical protein
MDEETELPTQALNELHHAIIGVAEPGHRFFS